MPPKNVRWGVGLFVFAVMCVGVLLYVHISSPLHQDTFIRNTFLPFAGLAFSLIALFLGHFSYPRVHNLKVYLMGYTTGAIGISVFALRITFWNHYLPPEPDSYIKGTLILLFLTFAVILFLPSMVKFRVARSTALSMLAAEIIILSVMRFSPKATEWVGYFQFGSMKDPSFWIGPVWLLFIIGISVIRLKNEFYLGGVISGCALFYGIVWNFPVYIENPVTISLMMFGSAPIYLGIGILVHWFSRMSHRIAYDPLLHIYNRDYCCKILAEQASIDVTPPFAIAMIDIDFFKKVNDTHGHQAGDAVLYSVAQTVCRGTVPQGIVCRYGGEELAVFFPQKTTKEITPVLEQVRTDIEKMKTSSGRKRISVTISCGVSYREHISQSIMDVIRTADKALYRAKKGGRNQIKSGKTPAITKK